MPGLESILEHPQRPAHPSWRKVSTHIHLQAFKKTYLQCLKIEREKRILRPAGSALQAALTLIPGSLDSARFIQWPLLLALEGGGAET